MSREVLAQDRLVSIGILPNVNSITQNRAVMQRISVYSRTTRLTSNQKYAPTEPPFPQRKRKRRQKRCSYCEYCPTIGLCLCEQYTHKYSTYRVAQHDLISSRERAWLKSWKAQDCTYLCPYNKCHPRVMSPSLPHLTLTTSTSSLSPISSTSPIFPTVSPAHKTYDSRPRFTLRCSTAEWRINTNPTSHRFWAPSRLRSQPSTPKRSSRKTSSPEELILEGILGQIRVKYRKDLWETPLLKMWVNLEKLVQRRPTSSHGCIPQNSGTTEWSSLCEWFERF